MANKMPNVAHIILNTFITVVHVFLDSAFELVKNITEKIIYKQRSNSMVNLAGLLDSIVLITCIEIIVPATILPLPTAENSTEIKLTIPKIVERTRLGPFILDKLASESKSATINTVKDATLNVGNILSI